MLSISCRGSFFQKHAYRYVFLGTVSLGFFSAFRYSRHAKCQTFTDSEDLMKFKRSQETVALEKNKFCVFSGTANNVLAKEVADHLGVNLGKIKCGKFPDGESQIQILESVRGKNIYIIQPTCDPINDNVVELMLLISTFRRASAAKVTAVIPYFGYARQDRIREGRETIAAADIATMLETAGVDRVITLDLHHAQIEGFFPTSIQLTNLDSLAVGAQHFFSKDLDDPAIACPSITGVHRAKKFRDILLSEGIYASLAFVTPSDDTGILDPEIGHHHKIAENSTELLVGSVKYSDVVIVDDMIDTGSRMSKAANLMKENSAKRIFAYATHGLFSGDCLEVLDRSPFHEIFVTDSIPMNQDRKSEKVNQISVSPLIAEAIRRTQVNQSLTILTHPK